MKLLYRGAESEVYLTEYLGIKAILKKRIPKKYRIKDLDEKIRSERTKKEAKMLKRALQKINVPMIFDCFEYEILMEYIDGIKLKNNIEKFDFKKLGQEIKKMHDLDIIHSDLTPSNILLKNNEIYFIDFGLAFNSKRIEDKATDLLLFKRILKAEYPEYFDRCWKKFCEGYGNHVVLKHIEKIERRARYL